MPIWGKELDVDVLAEREGRDAGLVGEVHGVSEQFDGRNRERIGRGEKVGEDDGFETRSRATIPCARDGLANELLEGFPSLVPVDEVDAHIDVYGILV